MPPARKSSKSSTSRRASAFKEPAAMKKLSQSLDAAQKALGDLRQHAGKDATAGTKTLYKGLGRFVSDARRDSGKFSTALRKDFEQAAKAAQSAAKTATGTTRRARSSSRSSSTASTGTSRARKTASRTTGSSTRRSSSSRSTGKSS